MPNPHTFTGDPKNVVISRKNAIFAVDLPITAIGDAENLEHPEG